MFDNVVRQESVCIDHMTGFCLLLKTVGTQKEKTSTADYFLPSPEKAPL